MKHENQLVLFANMPEITLYDRNDVANQKPMAASVSPRKKACDSLNERVVDDCVFGMGMTSWKSLIDRALITGHTQLFNKSDVHTGLRKPGHDYGAIPQLPDRGAEYVKCAQLIKGKDTIARKKVAYPSIKSRCNEASGFGFQVNGTATGIYITLTIKGARMSDIHIPYACVPFTDGLVADDIERHKIYLRGQVKTNLCNQGVAGTVSSKDMGVLVAAFNKVVEGIRCQ